MIRTGSLTGCFAASMHPVDSSHRGPQLPPPTPWDFPPVQDADPHGVVCFGADLEPGTLLAAYTRGLFPMPIGRRRSTRLAWWSPDPRGVLPLDGLQVSKSLRRSSKRYRVSIDDDFEAVIDACADPDRTGAWITPLVRAAYVELHRLGWAHSVEAWSLDTGELVGGLYGVAIGGLFAGESMFHTATDASKVALVALVDLLRGDGSQGVGRLLDVQWKTDHLATLGVVEIDRPTYLDRLGYALELPLPVSFGG